jgi:hypothetical protein
MGRHGGRVTAGSRAAPQQTLDPDRNTTRPTREEPAVAQVIGSAAPELRPRRAEIPCPAYAGALTLAMKPRTSVAGSVYASPSVSSMSAMYCRAQSGNS